MDLRGRVVVIVRWYRIVVVIIVSNDGVIAIVDFVPVVEVRVVGIIDVIDGVVIAETPGDRRNTPEAAQLEDSSSIERIL